MKAPSADERTFFPQLQLDSGPAAKKAPAPEAHYHGHRDRLRARYREHGDAVLADYEILEMLLIPRKDTTPIAKALIDRFKASIRVCTSVFEGSRSQLTFGFRRSARPDNLRRPF